MFINHNKKMILLAIPKTASTSIHIILGQTEHPPPVEYHATISKVLNDNKGCENYYKACFVRNPFERFVSTWFNLIDPNAGHIWANDLKEYDNIENFIMNFKKSKWIEHIHFKPQYDFINIDNKNKMNFIGRFENLQKDFDKLCIIMNIPLIQLRRYRFSKHDIYQKYYNDKTKKIIEDVYKRDLEYFNYDY